MEDPRDGWAVTPFERDRAYLAAVVERGLALIRSSVEGGRNNALNLAALGLAHFDRAVTSDTYGVLWQAAIAKGLSEHEATRTITSAREAGRAEPRPLPSGQEHARPGRPPDRRVGVTLAPALRPRAWTPECSQSPSAPIPRTSRTLPDLPRTLDPVAIAKCAHSVAFPGPPGPSGGDAERDAIVWESTLPRPSWEALGNLGKSYGLDVTDEPMVKLAAELLGAEP